MLSGAQNKFYWQLWAKLHRARPDADRKKEHVALGLPESHTAWHPKTDFDVWVRHCLAVADAKLPDDGEARRKRVFIGHLLSALGEDEAFLEHTVASMNRNGKFGGRGVSAGSLNGLQLRGVMIALKKECRRRWPTKEDLLGEIHALRGSYEFDEAMAREAVCAALNLKQAVPLLNMVYEDLLVVLSVLLRMAGRAVAIAALEAEHAVEMDVPF